jgi:hypothetical protein
MIILMYNDDEGSLSLPISLHICNLTNISLLLPTFLTDILQYLTVHTMNEIVLFVYNPIHTHVKSPSSYDSLI